MTTPFRVRVSQGAQLLEERVFTEAPVEAIAGIAPVAEAAPIEPSLTFGTFVAREPQPPKRGSLDHPALQLACYWGDALLQVSQHAQPETIWMGPTRRCLVQAQGTERALVEPLDGGFALHVDANVRACRRRGEHTETLRPGVHSLEPRDFAWLESGGVRIEASFANPAPRVRAPLSACVDLRLVNLVLAVSFVAAAFAIAAKTHDEQDLVADDLGRTAQLAIQFHPLFAAQRRTDAPLLALETTEPSAPAPKHAGAEGEAGHPKTPKTVKKVGALGPVNIDTKELVSHRGLLAGLAGPKMNGILGKGVASGDLVAALGNVNGAAYGTSNGFGGLGERGGGHGGGGENLHTFGIGNINLLSDGRDAASRVVNLRPDSKGPATQIKITDYVETSGTVDPEGIRRVIRSHVQQIRFCYETRLTLKPDLSGKIRVRFMVGSTGAVDEASIAEGTTIGDPELRSCILSRVRGWLFPSPKGGGTALVTYPFWLRPAGE